MHPTGMLSCCNGVFTLPDIETNKGAKPVKWTKLIKNGFETHRHRSLYVLFSVSVQYEHFHTILHNPFFIRLCIGLCQCEHTISELGRLYGNINGTGVAVAKLYMQISKCYMHTLKSEYRQDLA